ncbi:MAG: M48 family metallopeptidase [Alphaproteobacteria bacterium]
MAQGVGLKSHIWRNNRRSIMLLASYPLLLTAMFWLICWALGITMTSSTSYPQAAGASMNMSTAASYASTLTIEYAPLIITGVAIWFLISWYFHTGMIRKLSRSHPVTRKDEPELYNMLENLCISRGIKTPRLEIIETHARNAFASGINDSTYTITLTRGLINSLAKDELEAVLAHELSHILNRDVRLLIVTVIFTGLFGFLAQLAWSNIRYGLFFSGRRRDRNSGGIIIAIMVIAFVLWLGYMASLLMRFALSRRREYMADAGAIELTKNPEAMMRALMRIAGRERIPGGTDDIAVMCIENSKPFLGLFATHPPIEKRIKAISEVTNTPAPDVMSLPPVSRKDGSTQQSKTSNSRENPWLTRARRK